MWCFEKRKIQKSMLAVFLKKKDTEKHVCAGRVPQQRVVPPLPPGGGAVPAPAPRQGHHCLQGWLAALQC